MVAIKVKVLVHLLGDLMLAAIDGAVGGTPLKEYRDALVVGARSQTRNWIGAADWKTISLQGAACRCVTCAIVF